MKLIRAWLFSSFFKKGNKNKHFDLFKDKPAYVGIVEVEIRPITPKNRRRKP